MKTPARMLRIGTLLFIVAACIFQLTCQTGSPKSEKSITEILDEKYGVSRETPPPPINLGEVPAEAVLAGCDKWDNYCIDGYCVYNNIWGGRSGSQCIIAASTTEWSVRSKQPGGGVKSYPNSSLEMEDLGITVGSLKSCTSTMDVTTPGRGNYNTAWDIWCPEEVMIWMNKHGPISPWGSYRETVEIDGVTWKVYKNGYPGFILPENVESLTVNIKGILDYCVEKGWIKESGVIKKIQGGFEIFSTDGEEETFTMNNYSVSFETKE
jgi:hypothetical protein